MRTVSQSAVASTVLASAVADDATFEVAYPTGYSQSSFLAGNAATGGKVILNDNDVWDQADPGFSFSYGASVITVTNLTGASIAAGTRVAMEFDVEDGNDVLILSFPVDLAGVTAADIVTNMYPGVDGYIEDTYFIVDKPVTTAAKLASINLEIGTTNLTGGVIALTSANATPKGKMISGTEITANNRITRTDTLSAEASAVTAFIEGSGTLYVKIRKDRENAY